MRQFPLLIVVLTHLGKYCQVLEMADQTTLRISQAAGSSSSMDVEIPDNGNRQFGLNGGNDDDGWDKLFAEINETCVADEGCENRYTFGNVTVKFPYSAYKSQVDMMERIIEGVTTGSNCLLESPTGTGKTAALLCSLLAWQKDCKDRGDYCGAIIDAAVQRLGQCTCGFIKDKDRTTVVVSDKKTLVATTSEPPQSPLKDTEDFNSVPSTHCTTPIKVVPTTPTKEQSSPSKLCPETPKNKCNACSFDESPCKKLKIEEDVDMTEPKTTMESRKMEDLCGYCVRKYFRDMARPPRIYYCTRTHSQIAQVVEQLKKTAYKRTPMTILASREVTCVSDLKNELLQQELAKLKERKNRKKGEQKHEEQKETPKVTINDVCGDSRRQYYRKKLWEKESKMTLTEVNENRRKLGVCEQFYSKYYTKNLWDNFQENGAWDLEDIKKEGVTCSQCAHIGCYEMQEDADIIFCSYNYLIHPFLRKMTDIKYSNSVLVFDEAHNIEDICREAFSLNIDIKTIETDIKGPVDYLLRMSLAPDAKGTTVTIGSLQRLSDILAKWCQGIKDIGSKLKFSKRDPNFARSEPYGGEKLMKLLEEIGMTAADVTECLGIVEMLDLKVDPKNFSQTNDNDNDNDEEKSSSDNFEYYMNSKGEKRPFKVTSSVRDFFQDLLQPLISICEEEQEGIGGSKDFKGFITSKVNPDYKGDGWTLTDVGESGVQVSEKQPRFLCGFEIICLNPAVGFRVLRNCAFSIIVASGTLTPLQSFAGELSTHFAVTLQADHVIPTSNVWAGVVASGPSGFPLELTKIHQDDVDVQDEVGQVICDICYTVPNGILVFFPSYLLMRKMIQRWEQYPRGNSILSRITKRKLQFEEQSKDKKQFKESMQRYKEEAKKDGCILFAVFRGKVSEGIDFADEQARAVITIGIPFSNFTAPSVSSKKQYNDMMMRQLPAGQLLSGSDWYATQAFRAMNQGFGRCVRHRHDWGALIMIDQRMNRRQNQPYISGWIQKSLQVPAPQNFNQVKERLCQFVERMQRKDKANKKKENFRIEYEKSHRTANGMDETEIIHQSDEDDQFFPATPSSTGEEVDIAEMPTQLLNMSTSTVFSQEDVGNVAESSPEYSFREEIDESMAMSQQLSPTPPASVSTNGVGSGGQDQEVEEEDDDDDSISVYGRSPSHSPPGATTSTPAPIMRDRRVSNVSENSDVEMLRIAEDMESRASEDDDVINVSMPSDNESLTDYSQASSVSYHSSSSTENKNSEN